MNTDSHPVVVVFGSAVSFVQNRSSRVPRDIDVLFANCNQEDAEKLVEKWAIANGVNGHKRDFHQTTKWCGRISVPAPVGIEPDVVVLCGNVKAEVVHYGGFSSLMRAHGKNADDMIQAFNELAKNNYCGHIRVDEHTDTVKPENYCEGIKALRNAISHVKPEVWEEVCEKSQIARVINALLTRKLTTEAIEFGQQYGRGLATHYAKGSELMLNVDNVGAHFASGVSYKEALDNWFEPEEEELFGMDADWALKCSYAGDSMGINDE